MPHRSLECSISWMAATLKHMVSETWSTFNDTNLLCRAIIQNQSTKGVSFAPDLQPVFMPVAEKFREISGIYGIIDTDAWHENRQKFDVEKIKEKLISLHDDVRSSFDKMVTPPTLYEFGSNADMDNQTPITPTLYISRAPIPHS